MRIRSLYTKFFLFFIGGTIFSMVLVFILFHALFFDRALQKTSGFSAFFKDSLVRAFSRMARQGSGPAALRKFSLYVDDIATRFNARIWVTDERGRILKDTRSTPLPAVPERGMSSISPFLIQKAFREGRPAYFRTGIAGRGGAVWTLHIVFSTEIFRDLSIFFAVGLGIIVLMEAFFIFPLYRHTAKPLRRLRIAAGLISDGDLSARSGVRGRDEIRELGTVFDGMAENLERYVRGTRELAANISHELRTPLARIRLAMELLGGGGKHRETIENEIIEMDRLIGRILELSRFDLMPPASSRDAVVLGPLVDDTVGGFRELAEKAGMRIETRLPEYPVSIEGDPENLVRGLAALLENGITHGVPGGTIEVVLEGEGPVRLTVRNQAAGQLPDNLENFVNAFVKGDNSRGSGLGLSIALRAFMQSGGVLRVGADGRYFTALVEFH